MSIVLHGLGVEIDTGSSIVSFGLASNLEEGQTIEQAATSASIENLFVIDFGLGRRKATAAEHRRFKRALKMMLLGGVMWQQKKGKGAHKGDIEIWAQRRPHMKKAA